MSEHERTSTITSVDGRRHRGAHGRRVPAPAYARARLRLWRRRRKPKRFRVRKLRVLIVLFGLSVLAAVSAAFGMFMAVASDLPPIDGFERPARPSVLLDTRGQRDRHADRQRAPDLPARGRDRAGDEALDHRDRGPPLLHQRRRRLARHRARGGPGHPAEEGRPGRVDDPAAVRKDFSCRREQAHGLPEAARGGARLPPQSPVVEGADPPQLPELDLLRQRRLRDRVGRAHVLPVQPRRVRRPRTSRPCASVLLPHEAALLAGMVASPTAYDPVQHPVAAQQAGATSCCCGCSSRAT